MKKKSLVVGLSLIAASATLAGAIAISAAGGSLGSLYEAIVNSNFSAKQSIVLTASDFTAASGSVVKNGNPLSYSGISVSANTVTVAEGGLITNDVAAGSSTGTNGKGSHFVGVSVAGLSFGDSATAKLGYGGTTSYETSVLWSDFLALGSGTSTDHSWIGSKSESSIDPYLNCEKLNFTSVVSSFSFTSITFVYECLDTTGTASDLTLTVAAGTETKLETYTADKKTKSFAASWTNPDKNATYTYESSDINVFTVDGNGLVTAVNTGAGTLTLTTTNGAFTQKRSWPIVVNDMNDMAAKGFVNSDIAKLYVGGATINSIDTATGTINLAEGAWITWSRMYVDALSQGYTHAKLRMSNSDSSIATFKYLYHTGTWSDQYKDYSATNGHADMRFNLTWYTTHKDEISDTNTVLLFKSVNASDGAVNGSSISEIEFFKSPNTVTIGSETYGFTTVGNNAYAAWEYDSTLGRKRLVLDLGGATELLVTSTEWTNHIALSNQWTMTYSNLYGTSKYMWGIPAATAADYVTADGTVTDGSETLNKCYVPTSNKTIVNWNLAGASGVHCVWAVDFTN